MDFDKIEKKWQKKWEESKVFEVSEKSKKKKLYLRDINHYKQYSQIFRNQGV